MHLTRPAMSRFYFLLVLAAALPALGQSQWQELAELERAAESYARMQVRHQSGRVEVSATAVDRGTRLPRCEKLQPFLPSNAPLWGSANVGMRCLQPHAWSLFVPVTVRVFADAVVTARSVGRHQLLAEADLASRTVELTQEPLGLITEPSAALGRITRAALPAGATLRPDMLRAPFAVSQGQQVRIVFHGESFRVTSEGRSLSSAAVGEPAQVRTASGKVVKGTVQGPGVVEVR
jgi:flagellar basal body P-ring formation protein FlgA